MVHALAPVRDVDNLGQSRGRQLFKPPAAAVALMASGSAAAGAVHVAVIPAHGDWTPAVVFFAALAAFQLGWAASLLRRVALDGLLIGVAVNAIALLVWILSRTSGMTFGPHPGVAEPFGRSDVLSAGFQTAVVAAAFWTIAGHRATVADRTRKAGILSASGVVAAVSLLAVVAIGGASDHRHGPGTEPIETDLGARVTSPHDQTGHPKR
ncbi:MAG: hypothetical protein ACT4QF_03395 [Sporichthyaceae bacterium]